MRLCHAILKELLVLLRDRAGLAVLFIMPLGLVTVMSVIQDAPFRDHTESSIGVLFLDLDGDEAGRLMREGLTASGTFVLHDRLEGRPLSEAMLREEIRKGNWQLGVIIRPHATALMRHNAARLVDAALSEVLPLSEKEEVSQGERSSHPPVEMVSDPAAKRAFRSTVRSAMGELLGKAESQLLLEALTDRISASTGIEAEVHWPDLPPAEVEETLASRNENFALVASNSVQHNIPAWTVFAMFFIVIPLASGIMRERESGILRRLRTLPTPMALHIAAKSVAFMAVCQLQLTMLLAAGRWLMPLLGLDALSIGGSAAGLALAGLAIAAAAIGYGMLVGTAFRTHQQAMVTGVVSVVIMAAAGGIFIPLYIMPEAMQHIGSLSPLCWAFDAMNVVFLRGGGALEALPHIGKLMAFCLMCLALSSGLLSRN